MMHVTVWAELNNISLLVKSQTKGSVPCDSVCVTVRKKQNAFWSDGRSPDPGGSAAFAQRSFSPQVGACQTFKEWLLKK